MFEVRAQYRQPETPHQALAIEQRLERALGRHMVRAVHGAGRIELVWEIVPFQAARQAVEKLNTFEGVAANLREKMTLQ